MKNKIYYPTMVVLIYICSALFAQNQLPTEYTNPQELVSFNSDIDLALALDVLSEYSIQYAQKPLYDPEKHSGPIGIDIRSLSWRKALGLILSRKGLWYVEKPRFFEIVAAAQIESSFSSEPSIKLNDNISLKPNSREIKIETIFFEGDRKLLSEIGIDWSTFYRGKVDIDADQAGALNLKEDIFSLRAGISRKLIGVDVDLLVRAFDSKKLGKVLAQPQVIVTEGKEGDIQVGQDFSIKERDFAGNIIDRFYSTGTILKVTPFVFENKEQDGNKKRPIVFLRIHVERSTAHPDVVSTIINKSQANSYIQLYDGEETLIAGLYSTEKNKIRKGVPILKDLPWWFLGFPYLFGYNSIEESEKELVIIIKATLLKNVYDRQSMAQTDAMNLKNSIVDNYGMEIKNQNSLPEQLVLNTVKRSQASGTSIKTESNNGNFNATNMIKEPVKKTAPAKKYRFGKITKLKNKLALVEWFQSCDADKLAGKKLPVVRKDDLRQKMEYIGIVQIIETRNNSSVGKQVKNNKKFEIGDYLVLQN